MKYESMERIKENIMSPSMRREWIEIDFSTNSAVRISVSLHAEGVD